MRASALLRVPKIWVFTLFGALLSIVLAVGYLGGSLNSDAPGQKIPIAWVNADRGADGRDFGAALTAQITTGGARDAAQWVLAGNEAQARDLLTRETAYAAVVIPADFTARVLALTDPQGTPAPAQITVLSDPYAGPSAMGVADGTAQGVLASLSQGLGSQIVAQVPPSAGLSGAGRLLLSDPIKVTVAPIAATPTHSANGMSPFYYTLVLILAGFLIAQLLGSGVDSALGYAAREFLHKRSTHPPLPINRTQTLLAKTVVMAGCGVVAATAIELLSTLALGMPVQHPFGLWAVSVLGVITAGVLALALIAVIGAPGALVATIVLLVFGVPSSGGSVPPALQPGAFRDLGQFLLMRHVTDATRVLIFPTGGPGLAGSVAVIALWLVAALVIGLAVSVFYDRTGRHRVSAYERAQAAQLAEQQAAAARPVREPEPQA
ncbi:MAG TPA: ABC transporter permease [Actinocrinis sp.]|uniref:YhgE/Pip domain-containing protein n=1 Tax=Actinocrinis sp. TaxID=1920516 RepID=UPI002DDD35D6|nr:ABC transporter permease [Actinocrinis sp.]HEV3174123.1 ABC transporter permease [Actinocrinis sp.]